METAKPADPDHSEIPERYLDLFNSPVSSHVHLRASWNAVLRRQEPRLRKSQLQKLFQRLRSNLHCSYWGELGLKHVYLRQELWSSRNSLLLHFDYHWPNDFHERFPSNLAREFRK